MQKKLWIGLILLLVIPGLLFTVSCQKKTVKSDVAQTSQEEAEIQARKEAEQRKQEEMRKKLEEERLAALNQKQMEEEQSRQKMAARQMFINEDIHFEFDSSALLSMAQDILRRKAQYMRENPDVNVSIEGHCDERGTNEYNLALGDRRADSAKTFLSDLGIASSRMTTISYGEERPIDARSNEEAWAKNRRAHFVIE